jgi:hypothetical protein
VGHILCNTEIIKGNPIRKGLNAFRACSSPFVKIRAFSQYAIAPDTAPSDFAQSAGLQYASLRPIVPIFSQAGVSYPVRRILKKKL